MNIVLLHEEDRVLGEEDRFSVEGTRARHLIEVLAVSCGSPVQVGLLEGPLGVAEVSRVEADRVEIRVNTWSPAPTLPVLDLVLAVPRPKALRRILPQIAAMGVREIILLRTWKVDPSYLGSPILEPEHYRPLLFEGLMQGRLTREPRLRLEPRFRPFVEDRLADLSQSSLRLVAHPGARSLAGFRLEAGAPVIAAIGPEGGFLPYEVQKLEEQGFLAVSLGPTALRVETACVSLLAQLELLRAQSLAP